MFLNILSKLTPFYPKDRCYLPLKNSEDGRFSQGQNQRRIGLSAMYMFKTTDGDMHFKLIQLVWKATEQVIKYRKAIDTKEKKKKAAHKGMQPIKKKIL